MIFIKGLFGKRKEKINNKEEFLQLFLQHQQDIYRIAYVYVKNKEDALDIVQETAYKAFKNSHTLLQKEHFKTWLIRITINCAIDYLRKNNKLFVNEELIEVVAVERDDLPLHISLQDLLCKLDEREKTLISLKYYQECTFKEISEIIDLPLSTVKTTLYRALEKLRKEVRKEDLYEQ